MADERRIEEEPVEYIDCEVPQDMTLKEWRCGKPLERPKRIRAAAAAMGRAARRRRRVD
jgi:hypothetical protein